MSVLKWILIIYSLLSLLALFNKGIRHLYLEIAYKWHGRFSRLDKRYYKITGKSYVNFILGCLSDIFMFVVCFLIAPVTVIYHFPQGFKYRYTKTPWWKLKKQKPINKEYLVPALIIKVEKELPFAPDPKQVIYFENAFNDTLNKYISNNHEDITNAFKERGCHFIYLPKIVKELGVEEAWYMNPSLKETSVTTDRNAICHTTQSKLLSLTNIPLASRSTGLLRYRESDEGSHLFSYFRFTNFDESEIWEQIRIYLNGLGTESVMFNITAPKIESEDFADEKFDSHTRILIKEIRERVEALKQKGINEMVLKSLFPFETVELSRLVITREYRIFLPDYNNLEITMHPLPKAVFLLFLNHPEGILFKRLIDYREELIQIYKNISGREDIEQMEQSINDVVNPSLNSINEKCSRIREAFVKHFDDSIAENYYITGERAAPKKITLERELVAFEQVEKSNDITKLQGLQNHT